MEIAGYPHYENVCSSILRYFLDPRNPHRMGDLLLRAFMRMIGKEDWLDGSAAVFVQKEVTTTSGRIDLVIASGEWVVGIENKIRHYLHNDLGEYAGFLGKAYPNKKVFKVVLSLRPEHGPLPGSFQNFLYASLIKEVDLSLKSSELDNTQEPVLYFRQFIQTLKNLSEPVRMDKEEIAFLINNREKISELRTLDNKLTQYISQRAWKLLNAVQLPEQPIDKHVFESYDVVFVFRDGLASYKLECAIAREHIQITICDERNMVNSKELKRLRFFRNHPFEKFRSREDGRILIDEFPFDKEDDELIQRLNEILAQFKVA